jgi:internalin A
MGDVDFNRQRLMQDFAHDVGDMIALIADTLQPRNFEELAAHGFGDGSAQHDVH